VSRRLRRLRQALGARAGPWGGCLLEPPVLLRLARQPPASAAALADVPGVGTAIAEGYGATILGALGPAPPAGPAEARGPVAEAVQQWRAAVAREMGVPDYVVLGDRALAALANAPTGDQGLRTISGGPRFRAKFESEVRRLLQRVLERTGDAD
jgi:hypothetical protein